ncbi:MAG: N utilization substance protein B, partial [Phenylobacterium sp.]|nr:N utilization substance protein B [Phenylobacterium sp.]
MPASHQARSVARLAAVQALYQMEVSGTGVEAVVREFSDHRFDRAIGGEDGEALAAADEAFFAELVRGVVAEQRRIDP